MLVTVDLDKLSFVLEGVKVLNVVDVVEDIVFSKLFVLFGFEGVEVEVDIVFVIFIVAVDVIVDDNTGVLLEPSFDDNSVDEELARVKSFGVEFLVMVEFGVETVEDNNIEDREGLKLLDVVVIFSKLVDKEFVTFVRLPTVVMVFLLLEGCVSLAERKGRTF